MTNRKIRNNTIIFSIVAGLCNLVFSLALICVLFIIAVVLIYKVFHSTTSLPMQIAMPIVIIGGLVLDFILSTRLIRLAIIKFNLKDKINPKVADQYLFNKRHPNPHDPRCR